MIILGLLPNKTATAFTAQAVPTGSQVSDVAITIDHNAVKRSNAKLADEMGQIVFEQTWKWIRKQDNSFILLFLFRDYN